MRSLDIALYTLLVVMGTSIGLAFADSVKDSVAARNSGSPAGSAATVLRFSGSPADGDLIEALQEGFLTVHPELQFSNWLHGHESTVAGVYTGIADIAFMARELREPLERMAFEWALLSKPFTVVIANAGFHADRPATQLAVLVHAQNPLEFITLQQLDALFGAEHLRGTENIRDWGGLGLSGELEDAAIQVIGPGLGSVEALFFRRLVLLDSRKWNPEYQPVPKPEAIREAVSQNPLSIAFVPASSRHAGVKTLAIAADSNRIAVPLDQASIVDGSYPLNRVVSVVIHRPEGEPIPQGVAEFLRFVLGDKGQAIIESDGAYLPLGPDQARHELERLK